MLGAPQLQKPSTATTRMLACPVSPPISDRAMYRTPPKPTIDNVTTQTALTTTKGPALARQPSPAALPLAIGVSPVLRRSPRG
jgi:hypothetical protein